MGLNVQRRGFQKGGEKPSFVIAVAGNPNVGKSTLFNALTGMNQHTGNWPGKTVGSARGYCESRRYRYELVDTPGAYSLFAHSAEEEVTRDFLCFGQAAAVLVVCDATCLERNLNLVLQILELHDRVLVCVNLMDEARRRGIQLNLAKLEENLGVPVVGIVARKKKTVGAVLEKLDRLMEQSGNAPSAFPYPSPVNEALSKLEPLFIPWPRLCRQSRWMGLRALEDSTALTELLKEHTEDRPLSSPEAETTMAEARGILQRAGISGAALRDLTVRTLVLEGEQIARKCVICRKDKGYSERDRKLDRFLTGRRSAFPIMILLLLLLFWLTLTAANVPSVLLNRALSSVQDWLSHCFYAAGAPAWLHDALVLGAWRVLAWVVSVMLPPMAIFFPLFTLLEDSGYLPRIAYNLDQPFQCCHACGKQALCICMGLGCNAAGVVGCRIIDSPRERLIAILTNCFTPCNGRFPTLLLILGIFFVPVTNSALSGIVSAFGLICLLCVSLAVTFGTSRLLSGTLLKGLPSSFTLEMPPYRRPQLGKVLVRSLVERTLVVLGRAAAVAAPAGLLLWALQTLLLPNGTSLLIGLTRCLDGLGRLMGLDGILLTAFLLGFPANEIVLPIALMLYLSQGNLTELGNTLELKQILLSHGWTLKTALCMLWFTLFHWPCSTTLLTIRKETGSLRWTALAVLLPTLIGILGCMLISLLGRLTGWLF